jgi:hypothetical protein
MSNKGEKAHDTIFTILTFSMKKIVTYLLVLLLTFLASYFVFNEYLSKSFDTVSTFGYEEVGLSIDFPSEHNPHELGVSFGQKVPAIEGPSDEKIFSYEIEFVGHKKPKDIIRLLNQSGEELLIKPEVLKIKDLEVVKYMTGGMCNYPTLEVVGPFMNYSFSPVCGEKEKEEFAYMSNVIRTIEFLVDPIPFHDDSKQEEYCENRGGNIEIWMPEFEITKNCFINDGKDGIRCELNQYFDKECGH